MGSRATELNILRISTFTTVFFAVAGVTVAILCDSMTLMLDGLYSVVDVVVSFVAILVVRKIHEPPNKKYHYGYAKYEPFMTGLDGVLIMAICGGTIIASIQDIVNPDPIQHTHLAVMFAFVSFIVSAGFAVYMKNSGKALSSGILSAAAELWLIEGIIGAAAFVAFGISGLMGKSGWKHYTDYVDPGMCILFSIFLISRPVKVLGESFRDLVDANPGEAVENEIRRLAQQYCEKYQLTEIQSAKIRKAGRRLFIFICFKAHQHKTLREMHEITEGLTSEILILKPHADVSVSFRC